MSAEFYEKYFDYIGDTEAPTIYHRWCAVSIVSALLGRNIHLPFGHSNIYPNLYVMLVGNPGTRKGAALGPAAKALREIGYSKLAPQRLSPERFLTELRHLNTAIDIEDIQFETLAMETPSEIFVVAEEFGDFIRGNVDFVRLLTTLWDNLGEYRHAKLHGANKDVTICKPTVSIIGATTQQDIALTLPLEAIGQGFLSRFILVNGDPTGIKITIPKTVSQDKVDKFHSILQKIRTTAAGAVIVDTEAMGLLDRIYKAGIEVDDYRFKYYNTRRFTHLLKVVMVFVAMDCSTTVLPTHVINANTLLYATERNMPKALGEFGKAKHSDVTNTIINILKTATKPVKIKDLWKFVIQDLTKLDELIVIMRNLEMAERVVKVVVATGAGYLLKQTHENKWADDLINKEFLTLEEMG